MTKKKKRLLVVAGLPMLASKLVRWMVNSAL